MTWEACDVNLNSDSTGSFYSGDIVTGTVILEFKQKQKLERIDFLVSGTSKVNWTRPSPTIPHIKFYSQKKKVLHININLFDNLQGREVLPGVYDYSFHFALPNDLPSSFDSSIAKVKYCIKIKCIGTWNNQKTTPFTVLRNVNLNEIEQFLEPSYHEIHKMFWNTGTITLFVKTYTGFASKQNIPIQVTIKNERKAKISKLSIFLIQKLRYTVTEGHAEEEKKMCHVNKSDFENLDKETCCLNMDIPHLIPSSIHTQDPMINISYILRAQLRFSFHSTLFEDIPVTVATIPVLHYNFDEQK